jgi:glutamyl-tRNA reductase
VMSAKTIRHQSAIGDKPISVAYTAIVLARQLFSDLGSRHVLLIGAGEMIELCAQHLRQHGVAKLIIANRDADKAAKIGSELGAEPAALTELDRVLPQADIVISSTASDRPVVTLKAVRQALAARRHKPMFIVDIAVPRDVEPSVSKLAGVNVLDLDDLRDWADRGLAHRAAEAERVRAIVAEEVENFIVDSTSRQAAPLVASIREAAERVRAGEVERFESRLGGLDDDARESIVALTRAIVAKLLHEPSVRLRSQAGTPQGERNAAAVRDLFDLG